MRLRHTNTAEITLSQTDFTKLWDILYAVHTYRREPHAIYAYLGEGDVEFAKAFSDKLCPGIDYPETE